MIDEWLPRMAERGIDEERARALMASKPGDMASPRSCTFASGIGDAEGYMRRDWALGPPVELAAGEARRLAYFAATVARSSGLDADASEQPVDCARMFWMIRAASCPSDGLLAVAERLGRVRVDVELDTVRAGRNESVGNTFHELAVAGAVARVGDEREVRLRMRTSGIIEMSAAKRVSALEALDAAVAEDHVAVAVAGRSAPRGRCRT